MTEEEIRMHLAAGRYYGRQASCGSKISHRTEEEASSHARSLNDRQTFSLEIEPHIVEAYPCYWCSERFPDSDNLDFTHLYWHVGRKMSISERKIFSSELGQRLLEMETVQINATEPQWGIEYDGLVGLRVHNRKLCEGQPCCIHHPSDHHMISFPLLWRSDRGIMERTCPHGTGHPDPDDAWYRAKRYYEDIENYLNDPEADINDVPDFDSGIHGCDGCCIPGRREKDEITEDIP